MHLSRLSGLDGRYFSIGRIFFIFRGKIKKGSFSHMRKTTWEKQNYGRNVLELQDLFKNFAKILNLLNLFFNGSNFLDPWNSIHQILAAFINLA